MSDRESFRDLLCRIGTQVDGYASDVKAARDEADANRVRAEKAEARVKALESGDVLTEAHQNALNDREHWRDTSKDLTARVRELLVEREEQGVLIKRLQDENAEMRAHPMFAAVPLRTVADRIITSPEFREFVRQIMDDSTSSPIAEAAADLLVIIDREVKR